MKIYWFIKQIPEYKNADKELIKKTWMPSYWKTFKHWQQWIMTVISMSSLLFFISQGDLPIWPYQTIASITVGAIWVAWSQVSITLARPYLRELLKNT